MSTFIVRIELHPSDPEQAQSAIHEAMENAGFSRIFKDAAGSSFHLPSSEYFLSGTNTAEGVKDLALAAAGKVATHFMLLVSEATRIVASGLVPLGGAAAPTVAAEAA